MVLYVVSVRTNIGNRYVDSHWVVKQSAIDRCTTLMDSFRASGFAVNAENWMAFYREARIEDAAMEPRKKDTSIGGYSRAIKLPADRRKKIAKKAAAVRWKKD